MVLDQRRLFLPLNFAWYSTARFIHPDTQAFGIRVSWTGECFIHCCARTMGEQRSDDLWLESVTSSGPYSFGIYGHWPGNGLESLSLSHVGSRAGSTPCRGRKYERCGDCARSAQPDYGPQPSCPTALWSPTCSAGWATGCPGHLCLV